ncbi:MAG: glycosyltransferase family 2 protein [Chthoniobacteraceae bacterium]
MNDDVRQSIALVACNRPDSLRRCLESLRAQGEQPHEVIVSDDSDDEFATETRRVAGEYDCRWIAGPRRGLYANRNFAALQCAGTHIRTMDDDHTFPPGHFAQCSAAVRSDPEAVWTTGEIGFIDGKFHDKAETAAQLHPAGVAGPVGDPDNNWAIADGSTIYPAKVFKSGLRMVEDFGFGSSYLEFGAFLYRHGFRSRCVRGAIVEHHAEISTLMRDNPESRLFASLCYNLFFQPDLLRATRYTISCVGKNFSMAAKLPGLLRRSRLRWEKVERPMAAS